MINYELDVVIDKGKVSKELVDKYQLNDEVEKNSHGNVSRFVGIICQDNQVLVSLPTKFMNKRQFMNLDSEQKKKNLQTIVNSILKYQRSKSMIGNDGFRSSYPFDAYLNVYQYYQQFGLYHDQVKVLKPGQNSKIDWKQTFRLANSYIDPDEQSIIYFPFYHQEKQIIDDLVTECMAFCLNYTYNTFNQMLQLPMNEELKSYGLKMTLFKNYDFIVDQLSERLNKTYKDGIKTLLINLIRFFKQLGNYDKQFSLIQLEFENVWEHAVNSYLSDYFIGVDGEKFNFALDKEQIYDFNKDSVSYDVKHTSRNLEPDHYCIDLANDTQYIFDSKYMKKMDDLNHKQVVYSLVYSKRAKLTYNTLILPGNGDEIETVTPTIHAEFDKKYLPTCFEETGLIIYLIRLNIKYVLEKYTE